MNDGWIGSMRELLYYLGIVGADRDSDGKFVVRGSITSFLGDTSENADVVVDAQAEYFCRGHAKNLAAGLRTTSYGLGVRVF